jgi:hypothetical protein
MRRIATILLLLCSMATFGQQHYTNARINLNVADCYPNIQTPMDKLPELFDDDRTTIFTLWNSPVPILKLTFDFPDYTSVTIKQLKMYWNTAGESKYRIVGITRSSQDTVELYKRIPSWNPAEITYDAATVTDISRLIIESWGGGDFPDYIKLYGDYTVKADTSYTIPHYSIRNFMGVNSHHYDFDDPWWGPGVYEAKLKAYTESGMQRTREYDDATTNTDSAGNYAFNPTFNGGFMPERLYESMRQSIPGYVRLLCWQGQTMPILKDWQEHGDSSNKLNLPWGADRGNPFSWAELGRNGFTLASRYGTNKNVPDYPMWAPNPVSQWWIPKQDTLKGAGPGYWIEPWNEDNPFWDVPHCLSTPEMYASMSAFYDGHKGLIQNAGAKRADPNITVSSGGLASADPYFLHEGREWCIRNRGYRPDGKVDYPFDVYQDHDYPSAGSQYSGTRGGVPVEISTVPRQEAIIRAANKYADGMKVGIGEIGLDINPQSDINAPAHDGYSPEKVRAQQTVAMIFEASVIGLYFIDWFALFQSDNFADTEPWTIAFRSMAFMKSEDWYTYKRRMNCDYIKQLGPFLDYKYTSTLRRDSLRAYKFGNDLYYLRTVEKVGYNDFGQTTWSERKIKYAIPVHGTLYRFNDDSSGVLMSEPYNGDSIEASSQPILIVGTPNITLPVHLVTFTADKVNQSALIKYAVQDASKVEVERSADGRTWTNLGEGIFNNVVDRAPTAGHNFYRLKMYEQDGSFTYSFILSLQFGQGNNERVTLINAAGQILKQGYENDVQRWKAELKSGAWPMGVYYFRYETYTKPFLKQ